MEISLKMNDCDHCLSSFSSMFSNILFAAICLSTPSGEDFIRYNSESGIHFQKTIRKYPLVLLPLSSVFLDRFDLERFTYL